MIFLSASIIVLSASIYIAARTIASAIAKNRGVININGLKQNFDNSIDPIVEYGIIEEEGLSEEMILELHKKRFNKSQVNAKVNSTDVFDESDNVEEMTNRLKGTVKK